jgi:hypothetical protein
MLRVRALTGTIDRRNGWNRGARHGAAAHHSGDLTSFAQSVAKLSPTTAGTGRV